MILLKEGDYIINLNSFTTINKHYDELYNEHSLVIRFDDFKHEIVIEPLVNEFLRVFNYSLDEKLISELLLKELFFKINLLLKNNQEQEKLYFDIDLFIANDFKNIVDLLCI